VNKIKVCICPAYEFPHRMGGGRCEMPIWCGQMWRSDQPEDCALADPCEQHRGCRDRSETLSAWERNAGMTR